MSLTTPAAHPRPGSTTVKNSGSVEAAFAVSQARISSRPSNGPYVR